MFILNFEKGNPNVIINPLMIILVKHLYRTLNIMNS